MDIGLGTKGVMNSVAVGSSSHIYITSQWDKDEILHESRKVTCKVPLTFIKLSCEYALLMDLETFKEVSYVAPETTPKRKR